MAAPTSLRTTGPCTGPASRPASSSHRSGGTRSSAAGISPAVRNAATWPSPAPSAALRHAVAVQQFACPGRRTRALRPLQAAAAAGGAAAEEVGKAVVVWFKEGDLRVDDHPALAEAAASGAPVVPLFVFDPATAARLPAGAAASVREAVADLRQSLRALGSDLIVRVGDPAEVVPEVALQAGASRVLAEEEVEHYGTELLSSVASALARASGPELSSWRLPLWHAQGGGGSPSGLAENYREYRAARGGQLAPIDAPASVPAPPPGVEVGEIPSSWGGDDGVGTWYPPPTGPLEEAEQRRLLDRYLDGALADVAAGIENRENNPGASFDALFGAALGTGKLSPRRVMGSVDEARAAGSIAQRFGLAPADPHAAAAERVEQLDFHEHVAAVDVRRGAGPSGAAPRYWRWRGLLTSYVAAGPEDGPAVLLVHGFGAFAEHFRDNVEGLAAQGYRVYAATFPGFGRSEKIRRAYTQYSWAEFLKEFVEEVVGRPVVLCGNSIGGFMSASVAGDYPHLVNGLVLLNSAGKIDPEYEVPEGGHPMSKDSAPPRWLIEVAGRGLLVYLESNIEPILKKCYPKDPDRCDSWLAGEIFRASCDPGALGVFQSGAYLVLQGRDDPLNDAVGRAESLQSACPANVRVRWVNAGHCVHDEVPQETNEAIAEFVAEVSQGAATTVAAAAGVEA